MKEFYGTSKKKGNSFFFFNAVHLKLINFCECFQVVHENVISLVNVKSRVVPELQYGEAESTFSLSFSV